MPIKSHTYIISKSLDYLQLFKIIRFSKDVRNCIFSMQLFIIFTFVMSFWFACYILSLYLFFISGTEHFYLNKSIEFITNVNPIISKTKFEINHTKHLKPNLRQAFNILHL